jgi:hypothetical protein
MPDLGAAGDLIGYVVIFLVIYGAGSLMRDLGWFRNWRR